MACNGDSQTILDQARKMLKDVFEHQSKTATPGQWCTVAPKNIESLNCTPSQSSASYIIEDRCEVKVVSYLVKELDSIFTDVGHVVTFWEDFSMNLSHRLGLTYRETQQMDSPTYNEAKLKHHILHPILTEVSKAACIHPKFKGKTIRMDYLIEDELKMTNGRSGQKPGQKPSVDAVIQVSDADGKILALVPVEMKVDMEVKDYSQIACYINKLSSIEDIRGYIIVGIIIDKKQFRFAFSACRSQSVPLPIVHISPPIAWKTDSIIQEPSMLVLACSFLVGQVERLEYPANLPQGITSRVPLSSMKGMGEELCKHPVVLYKPGIERLGLKRQLDEQQKEIKEHQKEITELKETVKRLKTAINGSGEGVP